MLECLILALVGLWLGLALRACRRKKTGGCRGDCAGCASGGCRGRQK